MIQTKKNRKKGWNLLDWGKIKKYQKKAPFLAKNNHIYIYKDEWTRDLHKQLIEGTYKTGKNCLVMEFREHYSIQKLITDIQNILKVKIMYNHKNLSFVHPISNQLYMTLIQVKDKHGLIITKQDLEKRKNIVEKCFKLTNDAYFMHFKNQTIANIVGKLAQNFFKGNLPEQTYGLDQQKVFDEFGIGGIFEQFIEKLKNDSFYYCFDISKDYTQCFLDLENEKYPIADYQCFFVSYTFTDIKNVKEGYYLIEGYKLKCGFWLKDGVYPYFFIIQLFILGELVGTQIKKYMKTQKNFSGKLFADFVKYIYKNFHQKIAKDLINYVVGVWQRKSSKKVFSTITTSSNMAYALLEMEGKNHFPTMDPIKTLTGTNWFVNIIDEKRLESDTSWISQCIYSQGIIKLIKLVQETTSKYNGSLVQTICDGIVMECKNKQNIPISEQPILDNEEYLPYIRKNWYKYENKKEPKLYLKKYVHHSKNWDIVKDISKIVTDERYEIDGLNLSFLVQGGGGCGKSWMAIESFKECLEDKINVVLTFQNANRINLMKKALKHHQISKEKMKCFMTISKFFKQTKKSEDDDDVTKTQGYYIHPSKIYKIIVDEYSMITGYHLFLFEKLKNQYPQVIIQFYGDFKQIPAIQDVSYNLLRTHILYKILGKKGFILYKKYRKDAQRFQSDDKCCTKKFVKILDEIGETGKTEHKLFKDPYFYTTSRKILKEKRCLHLTYSNKNYTAQAHRINLAKCKKKIKNKDKPTKNKTWFPHKYVIQEGEPIIVDVNDYQNEIFCAERFIVKKIKNEKRTKYLVVDTEDWDEKNETFINVEKKIKAHTCSLAYALTMFRFQGATAYKKDYDVVALWEVPKVSRQHLYVGLSRVEQVSQIRFVDCYPSVWDRPFWDANKHKQVEQKIKDLTLYKFYDIELRTTREKFQEFLKDKRAKKYKHLTYSNKIAYRGLSKQIDYTKRTKEHFSRKGFFGKFGFSHTDAKLLCTSYCGGLIPAQTIEQLLILDKMYEGFQMINLDVRHTTERENIDIFNKHDEIVKNVLMIGDNLIKVKPNKATKQYYLSGMNINKVKGTQLHDQQKLKNIKKFILMSHFGNVFYKPDLSKEFLKEMQTFLGKEWDTSPLLAKYRNHYEKDNEGVIADNDLEMFLDYTYDVD